MEDQKNDSLAKMEPRESISLPDIAQLYKDKDMLLERSELNTLLNKPPADDWIKDHPIAKKEVWQNGKKVEVPVQFIPIERLQWLMRNIFGGYTTNILDYKIIANSVCVSVRLFYTDPLTGKDESIDGIGAVPLQTKAGAGAIEFDQIKANAVQIALPAAKTFAEKDAIGGIGKLFGSDINRFEESQYFSMKTMMDELELHSLKSELSQLLGKCEDEKLSDKIVDEVTTKEDEGVPTLEDYRRWVNELRQSQKKTRKSSQKK